MTESTPVRLSRLEEKLDAQKSILEDIKEATKDVHALKANQSNIKKWLWILTIALLGQTGASTVSLYTQPNQTSVPLQEIITNVP